MPVDRGQAYTIAVANKMPTEHMSAVSDVIDAAGGGGATPVATTVVQGKARVDNNSAGDPQALTAAGHLLDADPHSQYALDTEKGAANGIATLDGTTKLTAAQLPLGTSATTACAGNDARLTDARTPTAHHATHEVGGADTIQIGTTARALARKTAGAGAMELCTISDLLDFIGGTADGDILMRSGGAWARLAKGTAFQTLRMNSGATLPQWASNSDDLATSNTADIATAAGTDTYLLGLLMAGRMKAATFLRMTGRMTKSAAGAAAASFIVRVGTAGSVADTARCTVAMTGQTAVADDGFFILDITVRTYSVTGVLAANLFFTHNLATTGLNTVQIKTYSVNSAGFDLTVANSVVGVSINPGALGVWTFQDVQLSAHNLV